MTVPTWPGTLPQRVQRGFTESVGKNVLRTPMDAGPAKTRIRFERPSTMSVEFLMTTAEATTFESFVNTTLSGGVLRFTFTHPRKETLVEVRIVASQDGGMYNIAYMAPGYWTVTMQWEILP